MTGVSNGGGMSARMACDAADLLAAAAPVAGGYGTLPDCQPSRPLPMLEIHGLRDEVVPYARQGARPARAPSPPSWRSGAGSTRCPARRAQRGAADRRRELRWRCAGGAMVVHDRVDDAEHGWPGEDDLAAAAFSSTRADVARS